MKDRASVQKYAYFAIIGLVLKIGAHPNYSDPEQ
jgi:hypothetical protein